jgi:hypothetical protein
VQRADWDGTLVHEIWPEMGDWLPGAVTGLKRLTARGKVVIYTLRSHPYEMDEKTPRLARDVAHDLGKIRQMLDLAGLEDVEVYPPDRGKPPAKVYIDDRAVHFNGDWAATILEVDLRLGITEYRNGLVVT